MAGVVLLFAALTFVPRVREHPQLLQTFFGVAAALALWMIVLWARAKRSGQWLQIELVPPAKAHYIQGAVQFTFYAYWGWFWRDVYSQVPLIFAQLVFFYALDGLVAWSRGRTWRIGCGPLPIILSTNVFLWFKDDWFAFQFVLVALALLGKELIRWRREGRSVHVFNPSAFGLAVFAFVLLATGTTNHTWAGAIADSFGRLPHLYLVIFLLGLIVQYFFSVTLVTLSAVAVLVSLGLLYTWATGTYYFVFWNIPGPVFLGLHLLVTDPATSPRTHAGRVAFGALYGGLTFVLYGALSAFELPSVYDKLLPIPVLNLCVPAIERWARGGASGWRTRWETAFQPRKANLIHMTGWVLLFLTMLSAGYVDAPHEGGTFQFWRQAVDEGRPYARRGLLEVLKSSAREGSAAAWNELGVLHMEGKLVPQNRQTAVRYFGQACKLGSVAGSANLAHQFLSSPAATAGKTVLLAFEQLEQECKTSADGPIFELVGRAYETGHGRPLDVERARALYDAGCKRGSKSACEGLTRVGPKSTSAQDGAK